ncbi:MAG: ABC transporter permease [Gammaproteobacteria bacterium]
MRSPGASLERRRAWLRSALIAPVLLYILLCCAVPLGLLFVYSFYRVDFVALIPDLSFHNYRAVVTSATYLGLILKACAYGLLVGLLTAVLAYPLAFFIAKRVRIYKAALLTAVLIPLYTGDLIRIFAWRVMLGAEGVVNSFLQWLGLTHEPLWFLLFSPFATTVVLVYNDLPFMVLALWAAFEALDKTYIEAAQDLGASRLQTFVRVILPLTGPGLLAGLLMVLVLVAGDYLTPQLVGGSSGVTITSAIYDLFGAAFDWPMASALSWSLLAVLSALVALGVYGYSRAPVIRRAGAG